MATKERSSKVVASAALALGIAVSSPAQQMNDTNLKQVQFNNAPGMTFEKKVDLECMQIILTTLELYGASPTIIKDKNGTAHFFDQSGGNLKLDIYKNPPERPKHFFNARTGALEEVAYTVDISGNLKTEGKDANVNRAYAIVVENAATGSGQMVYYSYVENRQISDPTIPKILDGLATKVLNFGTTAQQIYQNGILLGENGIVGVRFKIDDSGAKFIALDYYSSFSRFMSRKDPDLSKDYKIDKQENKPASAVKAVLRQ